MTMPTDDPRRRLRNVACVAIIAALLPCLVLHAREFNENHLARVLASSSLTPEQQIEQVLNRLCFGPRPGDVERVKSMGIATFISRQLNPESIEDAGLTGRLTGLRTTSMNAGELADAERAERTAAQADGKPSKPAPGIVQREVLELQQAKLLRAVYSDRQLLEVMTDFWFNHFNVFIGKGADRILVGDYERNVIRPHALGKFRDLLSATATSPAMLFYLDNWLSVDPNIDWAKRQPNRPRRGLNENYARELMELHTLGVDGGYTQKDVTEVARCFTGWTIRNPGQGGGFVYVDSLHDNGEKVVLGARIPAGGGIRDGLSVVDLLANHPSTAHFISYELCRKFVSDQPPRSLVRRCAATFRKSDGDIRQVLETIFSSPEFYSPEAYRAKIKTPFELVASALRATAAETMAPPVLFGMLRNMGELLYGCQPPTGYPDTAEAWISTDSLLARMNFASLLASGRIPQT